MGPDVMILFFMILSLSFVEFVTIIIVSKGFPRGLSDKESAFSAEDSGLIPGSGRSPGEGNGNPLQCSCLGNPIDGEPGGLQSMGLQRVRHN